MKKTLTLSLVLVLVVGAFTAKADQEKSKFVPTISNQPAKADDNHVSRDSREAYKRFKNHERAEQEAASGPTSDKKE